MHWGLLFSLCTDDLVAEKLQIVLLVWEAHNVSVFARLEELGEDVDLVLIHLTIA